VVPPAHTELQKLHPRKRRRCRLNAKFPVSPLPHGGGLSAQVEGAANYFAQYLINTIIRNLCSGAELNRRTGIAEPCGDFAVIKSDKFARSRARFNVQPKPDLTIGFTINVNCCPIPQAALAASRRGKTFAFMFAFAKARRARAASFSACIFDRSASADTRISRSAL
ncbi:hypothetical protein, partial [Mesorhizobium sp.]|uniref:hypothetical protein n=1 Tax=Mesorhizobium sp. TaxID=1871066 RepID=UPI002580CC6A